MSKGARLRNRPHHRAKIEEKRDRTSSLFLSVLRRRHEDQQEAELRGISVAKLHKMRKKNAKTRQG